MEPEGSSPSFEELTTNPRPQADKPQSSSFLILPKEPTEDIILGYEPRTSNTKAQSIRWNPAMHHSKNKCLQDFFSGLRFDLLLTQYRLPMADIYMKQPVKTRIDFPDPSATR
jgi:hypothetical protein